MANRLLARAGKTPYAADVAAERGGRVRRLAARRPRGHGWTAPRPSASPQRAATRTPPRTRWRRAARAIDQDRRTEPPPWPWVFPFDHAKLAGRWSRSGSPAPATRWPRSPSPCQPRSPPPSSAPSSCSKSRPPPARTARHGATATGSMSRSGSPARPSGSASPTPPSASSTGRGGSDASTPAPPPATSGTSMTSSAPPCC